MSGNNYIGDVDFNKVLGDSKRYFYGLRRSDPDGTLYFTRIDNVTDSASYTINTPGLAQNDFNEFEYGQDFFDGRLAADHSRPFTNLFFDQYRWDNQNIYYYMNSNGEFVARINQVYASYPY
jgi:hypothetical protein